MNANNIFKRRARRRIPDLPVYSPGLDVDDVKRKYGLERVIKLASNENPLGPSPRAVEAVLREAGRISLYPDGACTALRLALAERLGIAPDSIIFGNGTDEIIDLVCYAFFDPGDRVVMGNPTFSSYFLSAAAMDVEIAMVPLVDYRHDVSEMLKKVNSRTKAVFVGTPHNPTGTICTRADLEMFLEGLPEGVILIWDEAYREYVESVDYPESLTYLKSFPNLLILRTFSKIYGLAGLRVGYGVTSPALVDVLERVRPPFNVNRLAQVAALAALEDEEHIRRSREMNNKGREYLTSELSKLGMEVVPSQANFLLFRFDSVVDSLATLLLERGIVVRDGASLGYPGYARLTVGTPEENRLVIDTIKRLIYEK